MNEPVILVPLDGTEQALAAVPVAKVLSQIGHMTVRALHVSDEKLRETELRDRLAHGTPILDDVSLESRTGAPAAEILRAARELNSRLVVMCRHSRPQRAEVMGRTVTDVIREAPCPVVLVPPERGTVVWRLQHVLVPHDGTPTTSAALLPAIDLASQAEAELHVAHVAQAKGAPEEPGAFTTPRYIDHPQYDWPSWSNEFAKRLASLCPLDHVRVRISLARGEPAMEILRLSEQQSTDLIVLAWRGRWDIPHARVLKKVLRAATCPVLILRTSGTETEGARLELASTCRPD